MARKLNVQLTLGNQSNAKDEGVLMEMQGSDCLSEKVTWNMPLLVGHGL